MADRKLVIENCITCPYRGHKGGFNSPAYVPYCRQTQELLPYEVAMGKNFMVAQCLPGIPDSCPLDFNNPPEQKD